MDRTVERVPLTVTVDQLAQGASWKIGFLYILIKYILMDKAGYVEVECLFGSVSS